ncbi:MAG: Ig-like domain-containing protein [Gemmataceae bacterium]
MPKLDITGTFYWLDGYTEKHFSATPGFIRLGANAEMVIYGSTKAAQAKAVLGGGWTIENSGVVTLGSGLNPQGSLTRVDFYIGKGSTLENKNGGNIMVSDNSNVLLRAGDDELGRIHGNIGSLVKVANTGSTDFQVRLDGENGDLLKSNPGTTIRGLDAAGKETRKIVTPPQQNKKTSLIGPYNFDSTFMVGVGGSLSGIPEITASIFQTSGSVFPGDDGASDIGSITFNASYTQTATGMLAIDINGAAAGAYDQLVVNGGGSMVSLAGGLSVSLAAGYVPSLGTVFTIIQNNASSSTMGAFDGKPNGSYFTVGGTKFRINYGMPGGDTNDVILTVASEPPNANDDTFTINEDTATEFAVLGNDTDPENDTLTITNVTLPMHGTASISGSKILYTPAANYFGTDSFQYTIADGHGGTDTATVSVTISPVNDNPTAVADTATVVGNFTSYLMVLGNDSDVDGDMISLSGIVTGPANGSASLSGSMIAYTPNTGFSGTDTLTYQISDGVGGFATAVVTITVTGVGGPPGGGGIGGGGAGIISGMVFHDANHNGIQDFGEFYLGTSVEVRLLDASGATVATAWTLGSLYWFTNVAAGTYRIQVIPPSGYSFSPQDQGGDDNVDSDVDSSGYTSFFLFSGNSSLDFDAGIYLS